MALELAKGWDGYDRDMKNHQSSLSGDELLALANTIINMSGLKAAGDGVGEFWKVLSYELQNNRVWVTKGIHEIDDRPHFNICMTRKFYEQTIEAFVLKVGDGFSVTSPPSALKGIEGKTVTRKLFDYRVSGLSARLNGTFQTYPAMYSLGSRARDRRMSMSIGNSNKDPTRAEVKEANKPVTKPVKK